ncbi:MAG: hypothetical protein DRI88_08710 [Bacteroidetes bacterium]|nr:MAG: hypothetical protein DRI88_08710 [Bacteroidota bacterium]
MMKRLFVLVLLLSFLGFNSYAQLSITSSGTNYLIDFDNTLTGVNDGQYSGSGFQPTPTSGQLDSDAWAATGLSDGPLGFGNTETSGDFARGQYAGGVSTGGFWAFTVATGNNAFGIQPAGSDWTPGTVTLRIENNTGGIISSLSLSYRIYYYNDQARANSFNFSHSSDDVSYTSETSLNFTSPEAASGSSWQYVDRNITIAGLNIGNGSYYYLKWSGNDVSGSLNRDEFGLDDITISAENGSSTVANPSNFTATAVSTTQIDLSWLLNGNGDDVMLAYSTTPSFGTPVDGTSYIIGSSLSGGGEILSNGNATSFNHTGLTPGTHYYYKAWSVDGSTIYSSGVTDDATTLTVVNTDLIISEVADPRNPGVGVPDNEKFVEIYNAGTSGVDFSTSTWYLSRQVNAGSWENVQLTGVVNSGETYVIAYNSTAFNNAYGFNADQADNNISGNGNDVYALYYGGDQSSGVLIDIYGEIDVNGYHTLWDYTDRKAVRKKSITSPNTSWTASEWVIIPADIDPPNINELTPKWHYKTLTWTGNKSSDWADPSNWDDGSGNSTYAPDAGCNITVSASGNAIVYRRASCNKMTIESGASVTINSQPTPSSDTTACFLVTGDQVTNNTGTTGLIVKSDANGDGAFILGANTTTATIERYLSDDMSHFISAPITDATADNLFQDHNPEVYLYEYHEDDSTYYYLVPTITPMPSGKGFATWVDDATGNYITANFDGTLMSSDLTLSLDYSGIPWGWNLVGNPYPCPLNWRTGSWEFNNVEQTVWIWNPSANTSGDPDGRWVWKTKAGAGSVPTFSTIPTSQAFFIRSTGTGASLTIPADARTVHKDQLYYKGRDEGISDYPADYVIVKVSNEQDEDEVWISFNEYGTEGFDNGWDATKMFNSYNTVSLYVPKETRDQCLEHLPPLEPEEERIVAVNFETTIDGEHTLALDMTHLPDVVEITLEDLKYNQMQSMRYDSVYTFVAFTEDDPDRFRIHFNKTTTGIEFPEPAPVTKSSVQIYAYEKNIYIKKEDINASGKVLVYDLYGREVLAQQLEHTNLMKIPVSANNTYLVVKVISDNYVTTSKVFIR